LLEEIRDRRYNEYALILQKAFRKFNAIQYFLKLKNEAADIMYQKKERRALSVNRKFYGDYIGLDTKPSLRLLIAKRENVEFAQTCMKYDRQFKRQKRDFVLTNRALYIIGRQEVKDKNKKKAIVEVVKRRLEYTEINKIALSHMQDNFIVLYPNNDYATVLEIEFKTEFLTTFNRRYKELFNKPLAIEFTDT
jgi:myosin-1